MSTFKSSWIICFVYVLGCNGSEFSLGTLQSSYRLQDFGYTNGGPECSLVVQDLNAKAKCKYSGRTTLDVAIDIDEKEIRGTIYEQKNDEWYQKYVYQMKYIIYAKKTKSYKEGGLFSPLAGVWEIKIEEFINGRDDGYWYEKIEEAFEGGYIKKAVHFGYATVHGTWSILQFIDNSGSKIEDCFKIQQHIDSLLRFECSYDDYTQQYWLK